MNGARTTYMRRGFLLTALAAVVLLAASPGTALAQVTVTGPAMNKVVEGGTATYTVKVEGFVPASTAGTAITITLAAPTAGTADNVNRVTAGEPAEDISTNLSRLVYTATAPDNSAGTTPRAYSSTGSVSVVTLHDTDAEDEAIALSFEATAVGGLVDDDGAAITLVTTGASAAPTALTIDDDETQTYVLELAPNQNLTEGDVATVNLKAVPEHVNASLALTLHTSDPVNYVWDDDDFADGTVDAPATIAVGPTDAAVPAAGVGNSVPVYVQAPMNDKNRMPDTVTLTAYSGTAGNSNPVASVPITFADDHTLAPAEAVTAVAMDKKTNGEEVDSVTEGGEPVYLTISVDRGKAADKDATTIEELTVDVKVAPANAADASVTPTRVTLPAVTTANGEQKSEMLVELSALADEDVGEETLMLHLEMMGQAANGSGTSTGMFEIMITDDTAKKIWPLDEDEAYPAIMAAIEEGGGDEGLNPGESFTVMTDDLFGLMDGYTGSFGVEVEGGAVSASASGDSVTVMAEEAGEAKVIVTGTARASSSFQADQDVSNIASITFPVEVTNVALEVTLGEPDGVMDGNLVEGNSYDIMVMANRAVVEDVEVEIRQRRGTADEDDFRASTATIMAGDDSATAELMVLEDMEDDAGHAMGETLHVYGRVNGDGLTNEETNTLEFTIWDMAVPALPLIAQLVLAIFLALGGARLYRRRQG